MILVLDGEFGERLIALSRERVWVVESATNIGVAEEIRRRDPHARIEVISQSSASSREEEFARALASLPLPLAVSSLLHVIGVRINHQVLGALMDAGLEFAAHTADGFTARQVVDPTP